MKKRKRVNHRAKWDLRRVVRAQLRDAVVLLRESGKTLVLFLTLIIGGALLFYISYTDPTTGQPISFSEALYGTFALIFFQDSLDFPRQWHLQVLYFVLPLLGLVAVADGVVRFGVALTNKVERGQKWQIAMASTYNHHIIVCGIGKVGYRVTLELLKFDREIVAIEIDPTSRFIEKVEALGVPVIIADARRTENLYKAGIQRADAVIPCTNDELANLDIALDAREVNPQVKIVLRTFDADLARRVEKGFGIHTAFSTSALSAPVFAAAAMRFNIRSSFYVGDTLLNISEVKIEAGSKIEGWTVEKLEKELDLSVVSYLMGEEQSHMHPSLDTRLSAGCAILVLASLETLCQLQELNQP
ncbi:MAG: potassium channel protein [Anaerolineales bacterium]|nr:potassium channel protein [Anaerolineales bacterium]